jgi:hypothetical protein
MSSDHWAHCVGRSLGVPTLERLATAVCVGSQMFQRTCVSASSECWMSTEKVKISDTLGCTPLSSAWLSWKILLRLPIVHPTRCTCYLELFILVKFSTCFWCTFRPSSGAQNCVNSNGICQTAAATCCYRGWDETPFHLIPDSSR